MQRGRIVLEAGSEGAPWDLVLDAAHRDLAGSAITLLPNADGTYLVMAAETTDEVLGDLELTDEAAGDLKGGGYLLNHGEGVVDNNQRS